MGFVTGLKNQPTRIGSKPKEKDPESTVEGFRETVISIAIALIFAFSFRIFVVEAFVIPTGSMAPTLLGEHIGAQCLQCGYRYNVDVPEEDRNRKKDPHTLLSRPVEVTCPMCHAVQTVPVGTSFADGDRILVQKFAYAVAEPKRYDVVVFKNPEQPEISYIKRLVGLPEESLMVLEGNIYAKPGHTEGFEGFKIARKTDRLEVQQSVWQKLSNTNYIPLDASLTGNGHGFRAWSPAWVAKTSVQGWQVHPADAQTGIRSRRILRTLEEPGTMAFDFDAAAGVWDPDSKGFVNPLMVPYNQLKSRGLGRTFGTGQDRIEELRFFADVTSGKGTLEMQVSTTARVLANPMAPASRLTATFKPDGTVTLSQTDFHPKAIDGPDAQGEDRSIKPGEPMGTTELEKGVCKPFAVGKASRVELWYCDDEAIVWQDGAPVLRHKFEVPVETVLRRPPAAKYPKLEVTLSGDVAVLERVGVDRDLYYVEGPTGGTGVIVKDELGGFRGEPVMIGKDQFFCMGDNSAFSHDGRFWDKVDAWVKTRFMQGQEQQIGMVPRELLMGRAFFVYYPAPYTVIPSREAAGQNIAILPNFQDMRVIK